MRVLMAASAGGYDPARGWDGSSKAPVAPVELPAADLLALAATAASADDDTLSEAEQWKTIATHGREVGAMAQELGRALGFDARLVHVLGLAGRWHDAGKAHEVFQGAIRDDARARAGALGARLDLAKAPKPAWRRPDPYPKRPGFRHELASTLLLFEVLRRAAPDHPALAAPYRPIFEAMGEALAPIDEAERLADHALAGEVAALSADDFDLLAWLICTHHGKVRCTWASSPRDQAAGLDAIHGVCAGDALPSLALVDARGARHELPETRLSLEAASLGLNPRYGRSWQERVSGLLDRYGPFSLAYLEAVLRIADWRASRLTTGEDR
jgi:CRISPR-associated endonuclease/helicase Cas3